MTTKRHKSTTKKRQNHKVCLLLLCTVGWPFVQCLTFSLLLHHNAQQICDTYISVTKTSLSFFFSQSPLEVAVSVAEVVIRGEGGKLFQVLQYMISAN